MSRCPPLHHIKWRDCAKEEIGMLLEGKVAVIYGAGGPIGGAVARTFAREGARVFLAGRTKEKLDAVAEDIRANGGVTETAVVDALDAQAVDAYNKVRTYLIHIITRAPHDISDKSFKLFRRQLVDCVKRGIPEQLGKSPRLSSHSQCPIFLISLLCTTSVGHFIAITLQIEPTE
jgi:short chain dehydrogenase